MARFGEAVGEIHEHARPFLDGHPPFARALQPFTAAGFGVSWASGRSFQNTFLYLALLEPSDDQRSIFGFEYQVLFAFSDFPSMQPRTMSALDQAMLVDQVAARAEPMCCILESKDPNSVSWIESFLVEHPDRRMIVPYSFDELTSAADPVKLVHDRLRSFYPKVDRFRQLLPLQEDTYFFGRTTELRDILALCRRGENAGIYGLRKTGKTSLGLKITRILGSGTHRSVFLDAQSPAVRSRRWFDLLHSIVLKLTPSTSAGGPPPPPPYSATDAADRFQADLVASLNSIGAERLTIVFDEIEWISPITCKDLHWNEDALELWQTIRSLQTHVRRVSVIVMGVSPHLSEADQFGSHPNPMFGILPPIYLAGFADSECAEMIVKIGKIAGLRVPSDGVEYIFKRYGGHPLLTRLVCSYTVRKLAAAKARFPVTVGAAQLREDELERDAELVFYVRHVIAEIEKYFPAEYRLLESMAIGTLASTDEARPDRNFHLFKYGVLVDAKYPHFACDVVGEYVRSENARKEGRTTWRRFVPAERRQDWLQGRIELLIDEIRQLERLIRTRHLSSLFGPNSFSDSHQLVRVRPPSDSATFEPAIGVLYRCLVESIEVHGRSVEKKDYFWSIIKPTYPDLHEALHRIKLYRHHAQHLQLHDGVEHELRRFLDRDAEGTGPHDPDYLWKLFQICIDELFRAVHAEINQIERLPPQGVQPADAGKSA